MTFSYNGKEAFHLFLMEERNGQQSLITTIPKELIQAVCPTFFFKIREGSPKTTSESRELLNELGRRLQEYDEETGNVRPFYYPYFLLIDGAVNELVLAEIFQLMQGFVVPKGEVYCSTINCIHFFVMSVKIRQTRMFFPREFEKRAKLISIAEFEKELTSERLRHEYVARWQDGMKAIQLLDEGVSVYILLDRDEVPLLILAR